MQWAVQRRKRKKSWGWIQCGWQHQHQVWTWDRWCGLWNMCWHAELQATHKGHSCGAGMQLVETATELEEFENKWTGSCAHCVLRQMHDECFLDHILMLILKVSRQLFTGVKRCVNFLLTIPVCLKCTFSSAVIWWCARRFLPGRITQDFLWQVHQLFQCFQDLHWQLLRHQPADCFNAGATCTVCNTNNEVSSKAAPKLSSTKISFECSTVPHTMPFFGLSNGPVIQGAAQTMNGKDDVKNHFHQVDTWQHRVFKRVRPLWIQVNTEHLIHLMWNSNVIFVFTTKVMV